jgi:hypothetical protein
MTEMDHDSYALIVASDDARIEALDQDTIFSFTEENGSTVCEYFDAQCFFVPVEDAARVRVTFCKEQRYTAQFELFYAREVIANCDDIEPFTSSKSVKRQQAVRAAHRRFVDERKARMRHVTLDCVLQLRPVAETLARLNRYEFNGDLDYGIHLEDVVQAPWAIWLSCCDISATTPIIHPSGYVIMQGAWDDDCRWVYSSITDWLETLTNPEDPQKQNDKLIEKWLREFEERRDRMLDEANLRETFDRLPKKGTGHWF